MFRNRFQGMKLQLNAPIPEPNVLQRITLRNRTVVIGYDFAKIDELHPKMQPANYHTNILKKALAGDPQEAQCLTIKGDATVLAKLVGVGNAKILMDAQEKKIGDREPGFTARAINSIREFSTREKTDKAEETSTDATPPSDDASDAAAATA